MKLIPKYTYIEIPNAVFILHTLPPLIIGRVWMYKSMQELAQQMEKVNPAAVVYLDEHSICITWWHVLGDRFIVHSNTTEEVKKVMEGMKDFFVESRVKKSPKYYSKFSI
jgi:hypothetical protein